MNNLDLKIIEGANKLLQEQEKRANAFLSTRGNQKLWNYFLEITKQTRFIKKVENLRKKYKVPTSGYDKPIFYEVPEEWFQKVGYFRREEFKKDMTELTEEFGLNKDWEYSFVTLLFYNQPLTPTLENAFNLCFTEDLNTQESDKNNYLKFFPIAIRVSPYASKRDILDYISKLYSLVILPLQNKYLKQEIKIGKFKTKKPEIQARNKFIYNHRHLSFKEIVSMVGMEFPGKITNTIDEGSVGKIISQEKKRRKEV